MFFVYYILKNVSQSLIMTVDIESIDNYFGLLILMSLMLLPNMYSHRHIKILVCNCNANGNSPIFSVIVDYI